MASAIPLNSTTVANLAGSLVSTSVRNALPSNTKQIRQAKARVYNGTGNGAFLFVGMSTFFGQGGGTSTSGLTGCRAKSIPTKVAAKLAARGLAAQSNAFFGNGNQDDQTKILAADSRLAFGSAAWVPNATFNIIGGFAIQNTTDTATMTFTPTAAVDSFRHYYIRGSSGATVAQQIDAEAAVNVNTTGTSGILATTVTSGAGVGTKAFKISRTGTGTNYFCAGIRAWDSTTPTIEVMNAGWASSNAGQWANSSVAYKPLPSVQYVITDCLASGIPITVFLGVDINDARNIANSTSTVATYTANMQLLIAGYIASGADVVLVTGNPQSDAADQAAMLQLLAVQYQLAASYRIPIIDMMNRLGTYAIANASGYAYDGIHPSALGYDDQATVIANFILNA